LQKQFKTNARPFALYAGKEGTQVKYIEVRLGEDFSLCGQLLRLVRIEGGEAVLFDIRKKKRLYTALTRYSARSSSTVI